MGRPLITAENVDTAASSGASELNVPLGSIVTPLALERAAALGVRLIDVGAWPERARPIPNPPAERAVPEPRPDMSSTPGEMSSLRLPAGVSPELVAEITRRVIQRLGEEKGEA